MIKDLIQTFFIYSVVITSLIILVSFFLVNFVLLPIIKKIQRRIKKNHIIIDNTPGIPKGNFRFTNDNDKGG